MGQIYVPVFKMSLPYSVVRGRRWSVVEHLILLALVGKTESLAALVEAASLPRRLVIEALINLLRIGWIEVRTSDATARFTATPLGIRRAADRTLKADLNPGVRWASVCVDRLTGAWLLTNDLDFVHERDLGPAAHKLAPRISAFDAQDGRLRDLIYLARDEVFERFHPPVRNPASLFISVSVSHNRVEGLPEDAPLRLLEAIRLAAPVGGGGGGAAPDGPIPPFYSAAKADVTPEDLVIGGQAHLEHLRLILGTAEKQVIIHSCFLNAEALRRILPDLEGAAKRKVRVELLWGLNFDPEGDIKARQSVAEARRVLEGLPKELRSKVTLTSQSTGSHLKALVYDVPGVGWEVTIGSCNYLSTTYEALEVSVKLRSRRLATSVMGYLIDLQIPPSGAWTATTHRLNRLWSELRSISRVPEKGQHTLVLLADDDHYACVRAARDQATESIVIGCDLYGIAAETSVLVPMETAAARGIDVRLFYQRPSQGLIGRGMLPDPAALNGRGIGLDVVSWLHGKFAAWDQNNVAISSFNWLSTSVDGTRSRGAELGVLISGPRIREMLAERLCATTGGAVDIRSVPELPLN